MIFLHFIPINLCPLEAFITSIFVSLPIQVNYMDIHSHQIVHIHPSSVLAREKPDALVYDEVVKTSRTYLRTCTAISPNWLPEANPMLFKRVDQPS